MGKRDRDREQHIALAIARATKEGANVPASIHNAKIDYERAMKTQRKRERRTKSLETLRTEPSVPSFLEQLEIVDIVNSVMKMLPIETRQVLALVYLEGKPQAEVADLLCISRATLKRRIADASVLASGV